MKKLSVIYTLLFSILFSSSSFAGMDWNSASLKNIHNGCLSSAGTEKAALLYCYCTTYELFQALTVDELLKLVESGKFASSYEYKKITDYCIDLAL